MNDVIFFRLVNDRGIKYARVTAEIIISYLTTGLLLDPVAWYGVNFSGTQVTHWGFPKGFWWLPKQRNSFSPTFLCFESLCNLCPSIIYSVPCDGSCKGPIVPRGRFAYLNNNEEATWPSGLGRWTSGICFLVVSSWNPRSRFVNSQQVCLLPWSDHHSDQTATKIKTAFRQNFYINMATKTPNTQNHEVSFYVIITWPQFQIRNAYKNWTKCYWVRSMFLLSWHSPARQRSRNPLRWTLLQQC